jgi:hypothetical protein
MADQLCPICSVRVEANPRYPRYVCRTCSSKALSGDGRPLKFYNTGLSGGFSAQYADTGETHDGHHCFIDGVPCYADEAYMGGIVISVVE